MDLKLRNRLLQVNNDPAKVWTRANGAHDIKKVEPVRGNSIYLEHLMPGRVSAITLKALHSAGKRLYCKHFLTKNAGIEEDEDKRELSVTKSRRGAIASIAPRFEEPDNLWEVVDGVKNYMAAIHMVRPYSYEALALDRVLHHVRFFARPVENSSDSSAGAKLQMTLVKKLFEDVLLHNSNSGRCGKHPATFETVTRLAKNVLSSKQLSETLLTQGEVYGISAKKDWTRFRPGSAGPQSQGERHS